MLSSQTERDEMKPGRSVSPSVSRPNSVGGRRVEKAGLYWS